MAEEEILWELEVERKEEEVETEPQLVEKEEQVILQDPDVELKEEEEEEGLEGEVVYAQDILLEEEDLIQVVEIVAREYVLMAGEEILWELEVEKREEGMVAEVELVVVVVMEEKEEGEEALQRLDVGLQSEEEEEGWDSDMLSACEILLQEEDVIQVVVMSEENVLVTREGILWEMEVERREEGIVGKVALVEEEKEDVLQGRYMEVEEEERSEGEAVSAEEIFLEGEDLILVVEVVAGENVLLEGEETLCELTVWLEEGVAFELELVGEGDDKAHYRADKEHQWEEECLDGNIVPGEEILQELEVERKEEVVAADELLQIEEHEVHEGPERGLHREEEESIEGDVVLGEQLVLREEHLTQIVQGKAWNEVSAGGEHICLDMECGGAHEVEAEQLLLEAEEHDCLQDPAVEQQLAKEESMQGELAVCELIAMEEEDLMDMGEVVEVAQAESEAVVEQQEEKPWSPEHSEPHLGIKSSSCSSMEALKALQLEMEPVNRQASRAFSQFKRKIWQRRKHYLELRSNTIQDIHGFWAKAFVSHPELSAMISAQDANMLSHMINLKVEEFNGICKIMLLFDRNPYFHNKEIVKEYLITITGYRASYSTPIHWHQHYQQEAYSQRHHNCSLNFFNWFSEHNFAGSGRIAEIISKELWHNPLEYFMRTMASA